MFYTPDQTPELIAEEYPSLRECGMRIERRFDAGPGWPSNAFLVATGNSDPRLRRFVAKAPAPHEEGRGPLLAEWRALNLLARGNGPSPSLLIPGHEPLHFLLLEYVEGRTAHDLLREGADGPAVFRLMGGATVRGHRTEVERFGPLGGAGEEWEAHIHEKVRRNLGVCREILPGELYDATERLARECLPALAHERGLPPVLIHRDVYASNFLIGPALDRVTLIDYGMAFGGRPLYDLVKLYILDLYHNPDCPESFLDGYRLHVPLPDNVTPLLRAYLLRELPGMIPFLRRIGQRSYEEHATTVLRELAENTGRMGEFLRSMS